MKANISISRTISAIASLLAVSSFALQGRPRDNAGLEWLDDNFYVLDSISRSIHSFAEPGYKEYKSSAMLISFLEENGFTVEKGVAGIPTAFVATFGQGEPVLGILAEYDALPELSQAALPYRKAVVEGGYGHGCGHNLLGTGSLAAAVAISKWLALGHRGTVKLFGCPAEEGGGAKNYMVRDGVFDGLDAAFIWHPGTKNCTNLNTGCATMTIDFTFKGKSAHAGAAPWEGRSALDAVEALDYMANMMREHVRPETRIHYAVIKTNPAPNVVPDVAVVRYYVRHQKMDYAKEVADRIIKAAEGAASGTGTKMSYELINCNYPVLANSVLCALVCEKQNKVGGVILDENEKAFCRELLKNSGKEGVTLDNFENVVKKVVPYAPVGSGSDAGSVSFVAPTSKLYVASNIVGTGGHSWQQVAVGGTTIGTKAVVNVGKIYYLVALDLYRNPEILKAAKEEFIKARGEDFVYESLLGDRKPPLDYRDE